MEINFILNTESLAVIAGLVIASFTAILYEIKLYRYKEKTKYKRQVSELVARYLIVAVTVHLLVTLYLLMRLTQILIEHEMPSYMAFDISILFLFTLAALVSKGSMDSIKSIGDINGS